MIEMSASSDGPSGHEDSKQSGQAPATSQRFVTFADRKQPPQQLGFSSITKGLHNFMSSMDAALKHSTHIPGMSVLILNILHFFTPIGIFLLICFR